MYVIVYVSLCVYKCVFIIYWYHSVVNIFMGFDKIDCRMVWTI